MSQTEPPIPTPMDDVKPTIILDARDLFRDRKEIVIEHQGVRYRLRITRRGRLILQK